ncbi:hypothetical protein ACNJGB_21120, partial [Mycobacterium tuberculosis]
MTFRIDRRRAGLSTAALLALTGCGSRERPAPAPAQAPRASIATPSIRETAQCLADLRSMNVA